MEINKREFTWPMDRVVNNFRRFTLESNNKNLQKNRLQVYWQRFSLIRGSKQSLNNKKEVDLNSILKLHVFCIVLLQLVISPLFEIRFESCLKHWIPNFLSFKTIYASTSAWEVAPIFRVKVWVTIDVPKL